MCRVAWPRSRRPRICGSVIATSAEPRLPNGWRDDRWSADVAITAARTATSPRTSRSWAPLPQDRLVKIETSADRGSVIETSAAPRLPNGSCDDLLLRGRCDHGCANSHQPANVAILGPAKPTRSTRSAPAAARTDWSRSRRPRTCGSVIATSAEPTAAEAAGATTAAPRTLRSRLREQPPARERRDLGPRSQDDGQTDVRRVFATRSRRDLPATASRLSSCRVGLGRRAAPSGCGAKRDGGPRQHGGNVRVGLDRRRTGADRYRRTCRAGVS